MTSRHLALCESIAQATGRMLAAARRADWDELVECERQCARYIGELRACTNDSSLGDEGRRRKFELQRVMLANDAAIRDITQPGLARLSRLIASPRRAAGAVRESDAMLD